MSLKYFVKIGNVSNLSDARYCAGMGVDQIGFNLNPQDAAAISTETFMELKGWLAGVTFVGEFGLLTYEEINRIQQQVPLDVIEVAGLKNVEKVHLLGKPISVVLEIWNLSQVNEIKSQLSYLDELASQVIFKCDDPRLFDAITNAIQYYSGPIRLIKGFDLTASSINQINNFKGIQLEGSEEEKPGFKDYGLIMDLLEALEVD
jgi:phosphoribosylanthranilate isomerase